MSVFKQLFTFFMVRCSIVSASTAKECRFMPGQNISMVPPAYSVLSVTAESSTNTGLTRFTVELIHTAFQAPGSSFVCCQCKNNGTE